ncbi:MAG: type I restriction endonuclease subunit R, partial [Brevefilum sp.]|nr:type I restriction endonuclease subunit R [Brevefilum sp.]
VINLPRATPSAAQNNRIFHQWLREGITLEVREPDGRIRGDLAWLINYDDAHANDLAAINQFSVIENKRTRRPDVVLFVNGLPLVLMELKDPKNPKADLRRAFNQIQTYRVDIPSIFTYNAICVISDNHDARAATFLSDWEWYIRWRTVDGAERVPKTRPQMPILTRGLLAPERLLDVVRHFILFKDTNGVEPVKILTAYHQYHAARQALGEAVKASRMDGDHRVGVIWHTQGSGKSLSMLFFSGLLIGHPALANPTLVVITDRNDLDDQLFGTFSQGKELLRQRPQQAESRAHLRSLLNVAAGGVYFTTAQKFLPAKGEKADAISQRHNVIVIADEAHRSQYGFIDGFARAMRDTLPNASFIGFTGTPIALTDRNTRQVFGDYISVYDIQNAIDDEVTVPIYYEARLANIDIDDALRPFLDQDFEEATASADEHMRDQLRRKWAALEAAIGTESRLGQVAEDIIAHFEARQSVIQGKGMIVTYSRRIAIDLYQQIVGLRPQWHSTSVSQGKIKVVISGAADDPIEWQPFLLNRAARKDVEMRFKEPKDDLQLVIVCDMWLTGFDVPPLHTMYLDKPLQGHSLMQAIARVNRVYKDKEGGLVVDYLGVGEALREAVRTYTQSGGEGEVVHDQAEALAVLKEKFEIVSNLFHGFDWSGYLHGDFAEIQSTVADGVEHILVLKDGKKRLLSQVSALSKAFSLAVPLPEAFKMRDDIAFFQEVRAQILKYTRTDESYAYESYDQAIRQIVERAIVPEGVIDIFDAAGIEKPDISILSPTFLQGIQAIPQKNLAVELLRKLLKDEIKSRAHRSVVLSESFTKILEETIQLYQNRTIDAATVIMEMMGIADQIKAADQRGEDLGLTQDEYAFYTALAENESAIDVLGDEQLAVIARKVLEVVQNNTSIDWTEKKSVRAHLRRMVKRVLRRYGYPPDKQEQAVALVLQQAELSAHGMVEG